MALADKQPSSAHAFFITENNPHIHSPELAPVDSNSGTAEDLRQIVKNFIDVFVDGGKNPNRSVETNGAIGVYEAGDNETDHVHIAVFAKNAIKFSSLQKKFPHANIQKANGTVEEIFSYILKQGQHSDKHHTQKCKPVKWGDWFHTGNTSKGEKVSIFEQIDAMLDEGMKPRQIYAEGGVRFSRYHTAIETAYNARLLDNVPAMRENFVTYHVGSSGTGKSYSRVMLLEEYGHDEVYIVDDYANPWDMYNFEKIIFLDELRGDSLRIPELLAACDKYTYQLRCRYANKIAVWNEVHIASILPPEVLFREAQKELGDRRSEPYEQFKRRIDSVVYHTKCGEEYRSFKVPASEYESLARLKARFEESIDGQETMPGFGANPEVDDEDAEPFSLPARLFMPQNR